MSGMMQDTKSSKGWTISKLRELGMIVKSCRGDAINDELGFISERLIRIRDDKLACFVVTLFSIGVH